MEKIKSEILKAAEREKNRKISEWESNNTKLVSAFTDLNLYNWKEEFFNNFIGTSNESKYIEAILSCIEQISDYYDLRKYLKILARSSEGFDPSPLFQFFENTSDAWKRRLITRAIIKSGNSGVKEFVENLLTSSPKSTEELQLLQQTVYYIADGKYGDELLPIVRKIYHYSPYTALFNFNMHGKREDIEFLKNQTEYTFNDSISEQNRYQKFLYRVIKKLEKKYGKGKTRDDK